jgi:hypothetical protein
MSAQWLPINEYAKLVHMTPEMVESLVERGKLDAKKESGQLMINSAVGAGAVVLPQVEEQVVHAGGHSLVEPQFVEKTIGTILNLHEKVIDSKDETIDSLKSENDFMKDALVSMQELYDEDRRTIEALTKQLEHSQGEITFLKRKYKLMWGKVVEDYAAPKDWNE